MTNSNEDRNITNHFSAFVNSVTQPLNQYSQAIITTDDTGRRDLPNTLQTPFTDIRKKMV